MQFGVNWRFWLLLLQLVGVMIPLVGIFVLMSKEQNKSSANLMVANRLSDHEWSILSDASDIQTG